jgi:hypothetical protein
MKVVSPSFPGLARCGQGFRLNDEWYAMYRFNPEMHVILVQDTKDTKGVPAPSVSGHLGQDGWPRARVLHVHGAPRGCLDQQDLPADRTGGLGWALGDVDADITPNFNQVTPEAPTS